MYMYYVTMDSEGERILGNAKIEKYQKYGEARDYLLDSFTEVEEGFKIKIVPGCFDDYWIKTHGPPQSDNTCIDPFSWTDVTVRSLGQHPGSGYRITPIPQVLVAKLVSIKTSLSEGVMNLSITSTTIGPFEDGSFRAGVRVEISDQTSFVYSRQGPFPTKDEASRVAQAFLQYVHELVDKALVEVKYEKLIELPHINLPQS